MQKHGYAYMDYKLLKQLYNQQHRDTSYTEDFLQALWHGIAHVNSVFVERECLLLTELSRFTTEESEEHELEQKALSSEARQFFDEVNSLFSCAMLNVLAVFKIAKKHDKSSKDPCMEKVLALWKPGPSMWPLLCHCVVTSAGSQRLRCFGIAGLRAPHIAGDIHLPGAFVPLL